VCVCTEEIIIKHKKYKVLILYIIPRGKTTPHDFYCYRCRSGID